MRIVPLSLISCLLVGGALAQPASTPPGTPQHNPAVAATTGTNDSNQPAKGANSFTEAQAKNRLTERGVSDLTDMAKDNDGIWRGSGKLDGNSVQVWVDYKGNAGVQQ